MEDFGTIFKKSGIENVPDNDRIYVFISSSMPLSTLRAYAADIDKINDPSITMVMKGFIGGIEDTRPTLSFIKNILMLDPDGNDVPLKAHKSPVIIDPALFRKYDIKKVPTIIYTKAAPTITSAKSQMLPDPGISAWTNKKETNGYRIEGDVPIEYALVKMEEKNHSKKLNNLLKKLRVETHRDRETDDLNGQSCD